MIDEDTKEIIDFYIKSYRLISEKKFDDAGLIMKEYSQDILYKNLNRNMILYLFMHIGLLRDKLDSTQKGKQEFELKAKDIVTAINKLVLIVIYKIEKFPDNERDVLFEEGNRLFEPIFTSISEEKPGFAYFGHIEIDREYYKEIYSKMIDKLKIEDKIELKNFSEWKKKYNEELAKKIGIIK